MWKTTGGHGKPLFSTLPDPPGCRGGTRVAMQCEGKCFLMFPWVFHITLDFPSASCTPGNQEKLNPTGGKLFQGGPGWRKISKMRGNKNMLNSMCFHYFGAGTECLLKCHLILGNFSLGWDMPRKPAHHSSCLSRESALVLALDRRGAF